MESGWRVAEGSSKFELRRVPWDLSDMRLSGDASLPGLIPITSHERALGAPPRVSSSSRAGAEVSNRPYSRNASRKGSVPNESSVQVTTMPATSPGERW